MNRLLFASLFLFHSAWSIAQTPAYKDPSHTVEERVKDLLNRMTPEEKFWQLFMIPGDLDAIKPGQFVNGIFGLQVSAGSRSGNKAEQLLQYNTSETALAVARKINAIQEFFIHKTRLGIPIIPFDEALHGLVRKGATAFPQSIALAASFDTSLMNKVATAIAEETKSRGIRDILSPVINIAGDVRWGRTEETYGEDPYLTSLMGLAFMKSFEDRGIITTPKHYLANVGDGGRDSYPIHFNERLLKEIYLPPFKTAFQEAGARSVMTSYNSVDGSPATASKWLLTDILKEEYGFRGFVISDASAVGGANVLHFTAADYAEAGKKSIEAGLDVIFQTEYDHYKLFIGPFLDGSIPVQRIDDAVSRVLRAKFELGLFENPFVVLDTTKFEGMMADHRRIAQQAAAESFVLLQNKHNTLPFNPSVKRITVIGEDAGHPRLGGYSGPGNHVTSILEGIRKMAGPAVSIDFSPGVPRIPTNWQVIPRDYLFTDSSCKQNGLTGAYYRTVDPNGKPDATRTDPGINFHWTLYGPDNLGTNRFYSIRWSGVLKSPESGIYKIGLDGNDGFRLYLNNKLVIDRWVKQSYHTELAEFRFEKNKLYSIRVEFKEPVGNAHIRLIWTRGISDNTDQAIRDAVLKAGRSDAVVITAGITEGEFQDRALLTLPGRQEELIRAVAATGKPVVVLLIGGSAVVMNRWIDKVNSIVQCWYPGEAGGEAVADMLFGKTNPAGRLPITFPTDESQLPLVYNHKPTGRGDDYNNLSGQPLFPFGFGLSYTSFEYSDLRLDRTESDAASPLTVSCTIRNTGTRPGEEVVQLYLHDELASVARPVMELKGFQRIRLAAGEKKTVSFTLDPESFKMFNREMQWVTEPGEYRVMIGASSRDIRLEKIVSLRN